MRKNPSSSPLSVEVLEDRSLMNIAPVMTMPEALTALETQRSEMFTVAVRVDGIQHQIDAGAALLFTDQSAASSLQTEWAAMQSTLDAAVETQASIATDIHTTTNAIEVLVTEQGTLEPQVPVIEQQVNDLQSQIAALTVEREQVMAALTDVETQLEESTAKLVAQNDVFITGTDDVATKRTAVDAATATLQNDQTALQTATSSLSQTQTTLQNAQTVLAADQKLLADAKLVLQAATKKYNDLVKRYGSSTSWRRKLEIANAKAAMDAAAKTVNDLTVVVQNDQIAVNAASSAVTTWTKNRDTLVIAVATDTNALTDAQTALALALSALDGICAERERLIAEVAQLQADLEVVRAQLRQGEDGIAEKSLALADRTGDREGLRVRLGTIGDDLAQFRERLHVLGVDEVNARATVEWLQSESMMNRQAHEAALASIMQDEGVLASANQDLLFANEQLAKEMADVEAMQAIVSQVIQWVITETADTPATAPTVEYADTRESFVTVRSSVVLTLSGDWLELRTQHFDGTQSFTLGGTVITPQKGSRIITMPVWAAPEEIRWDPAVMQDVIDRQMKTWHAPAPLSGSADLFKASSLGQWTVETVSSDGTATTLTPAQIVSDIGGVQGLRGVAPDGMEGAELLSVIPRMEMTHPKNGMTRFTFDNMPTGYTIEIDRIFSGGSYAEVAAREPITPGIFTLTFDDKWAQQRYAFILRDAVGTTVDDGSYDCGLTLSRSFTSVPSPLPPGTPDLPLTVAVNTGETPVAISSSPDGTMPLASRGLLVRPTAGKDVRLTFAPNGAGIAMIHELLTDLDPRAGDGITYTLILRHGDGTTRQLASRQLPNGAQGGLFDRETPLPLAKGDAFVLTLSSGLDDRCDAIAVQFDVAFLPQSYTDLPDRPMGRVAGSLNSLLGTDLIARANLFPEGELNLASSSDAIARAMVGADYDTMSESNKSDMRSGIETAQAAVWPLYVEIARQEFDWVLMKMNGVVMTPNDGPLNDGHAGSYFAQIPNLPSRATIRDRLWPVRDDLYKTSYVRICEASIIESNREIQNARNAQLTDQAVHDALAAQGLLTPVNKPASERTIAEQVAIDAIFITHTGSPDRAGWVLADFQRFDAGIATAQTSLLAMLGDPPPTEVAHFDWVGIQQETAAMNRLLSLYDPARAVSGVRTDTLAGRIVAGFLTHLSTSDALYASYAEDLARVTGVDLTGVACGTLPAETAFTTVKNAFVEKGYSTLFTSENSFPWQAHVGKPYVAGDISTAYTDTDGEIRLRLDLPTIAQTFSGSVSLLDTSGVLIPGGGQIAVFEDTLLVTIPMSAIRNLSPAGAVHKQFLLEVRYDRVNGLLLPMTVVSQVMRVEVEAPLKDLSTLPVGAEHMKENVILSVLANNNSFPLQDPEISQWSWNIASEMHDGLAAHAVDLNLDGASDHGKQVRVPTRGQVVRAGTDGTHTVILRHETSAPDGSTITWYTKYLHMENVGTRDAQGNLVPLAIDRWLDANTVFGQVSDIGSPGQFHFHFEVMTDLTDGYHGHTIDLRKLLTDSEFGLGITRIYAEDAGADGLQEAHADNQRFRVEWNNNVGGFVTMSGSDGATASNPQLILDRSDQYGETDIATVNSNQYWIAWHPDPAKRVRVVWVADLPDGTKINAWLDANDFSKKWDPTLQEFLPL